MLRSAIAGVVLLSSSVAVFGQWGPISGLKLLKPEDGVDVRSVPPPSGALVLFDGSNLDQWVQVSDGGPATWKIIGKAVQVGKGDIRTRADFAGHFRLHAEFRVPYLPGATGLDRGNSGIYVQGLYQVQILDSYGQTPDKTSCGAIANVVAPRLNACKAPTIWQSFDIEFWPARFARRRTLRSPRMGIGPDYYTWGSLRMIEPARITVLQNGITIHDKAEISTDPANPGLGGGPGDPGPIMLQDYYGQPVQFRNIWLVRDGDLVSEEYAADEPRPARVTVRLPAGAALWFNDVKLAGTGSERSYLSPPLESGYKYSYEIKASWPENGRQVERVKTVKIKPGGRVVVDFQK